MPAGNIPNGRCRVMRLQQMVRDIMLPDCSRLAEQWIRLGDAAAHLERTAPVENGQRIAWVRQVFGIVPLICLAQISASKGVEPSKANAIRPVTLVDVGKGARRTQEAKRKSRKGQLTRSLVLHLATFRGHAHVKVNVKRKQPHPFFWESNVRRQFSVFR